MKLKQSIIFSGKICSGKSTLAKIISQKFSYPIMSFGKYLESYCIENEVAPTRLNKQNFGEKFVSQSPVNFLENVIKFNIENYDNKTVIFDGVRHLSILNAIENLSQNTYIFYLDINFTDRYNRYLLREKMTEGEESMNKFVEEDSHTVELDILQLKERTQLVLPNDSLDAQVQFIQQHLSF